MRTAFRILWLSLLALACADRDAPGEEDAGPPWRPGFDLDAGEDQSDDRWTLMMYEDGDNNLEHNLLSDVNEMELAQIPENVKIIVLLDRVPGYDTTNGDWRGAKLFELRHDENLRRIGSPRLADPDHLGLTDSSPDGEELDMGAPETLAGFIAFCQERYPADHYILHLSGHGDGWRDVLGQVPSDPGPTRAVCTDDSSKTALTAREEIPEAIAGRGIEAITMDACRMGTVEVAFALAPHADYAALSASDVPQAGWDYTALLDDWFSHPSARNWVLAAVRAYQVFYAGHNGVGLTAVALGGMPGFTAAFDRFVRALGPVPADALREIRDQAFRPARAKDPAMRDLVEFAIGSREQAGDAAVDALLGAYDDLILSYWYSPGLARFRGLSIYAPGSDPAEGGPYQERYGETPFARETGWDELVRSML